MTAKEMFKELGYEDVTDYGNILPKDIDSEYYYFAGEQSIQFWNLYKCVAFKTKKDAWFPFAVYRKEELEKLTKAIETKMVELGWWNE